MSCAIHILSSKACSGKKLISLGLFQAMLEKCKNPTIFRPLQNQDQSNMDLNLLKDHFKLSISEENYGLTWSEARELVAKGKRREAISKILDKYLALTAKYDGILCLCSDYRDAEIFEFSLSAEIASNIGGSVLLLHSCQKDSNATNIAQDLGIAIDSLATWPMTISAVILNRCPCNQQELANIKAQYSTCLGNDLFLAGLPVLAELGHEPRDLELSQATKALEHFKANINGQDLIQALCQGAKESKIITPLLFEKTLLNKAKAVQKHVVLAEGEEIRILKATHSLLADGIAKITLLGDPEKIKAVAASEKLDISAAQIVDPKNSPNAEKYAESYAEFRKAKGVSIEKAREIMQDASYYATMMVKLGDADAMVSGAINTTAHTIRPAFEFVKTKPSFSVVSSCFLMCMSDRILVFGDCAVNPNPTPKQLSEIAIASAQTAKIFGVEPRVAMLSYSTGSSGKGPDVDAVIEATNLAKEKAPDLLIEGPIQYDAAIVPEVAQTKLPNSPVAGKATVFIFPNLNSGNNAYKAVQRAANAIAIGPILQGLNKPVNDLSRGCTVPDIINTVAITAIQAAAIAENQ